MTPSPSLTPAMELPDLIVTFSNKTSSLLSPTTPAYALARPGQARQKLSGSQPALANRGPKLTFLMVPPMRNISIK